MESDDFLQENDEGHFSSEYIQSLIVDLYKDAGFTGFSFQNFKEQLPFRFSDEEIKTAVGKLIAADYLEYVDFRCYKIYRSFNDYLDVYLERLDNPRIKTILYARYRGETLNQISNQLGVTRERVRQIANAEIKKLKLSYQNETGTSLFDEDYYQYLFTTYNISKDIYINHLSVSERTYEYLSQEYTKGTEDLEKAVSDEKIDVGLRLRLLAFINQSKIEIDGVLLDNKRSVIEFYIIEKNCKEEIQYDDFTEVYNDVLRRNHIPFDGHLYITEANARTSEARIRESQYCLWKEGRRFRFYNINAHDFSDLLDVLNLSSYRNTEVSTLKFMNDYPDIMAQYDIHDQYELHNLLRKIIDTSTCNDIDFVRQPTLRFGQFNRISETYALISAFSPISQKDLVDYIYDEYGYDRLYIMMSILPHFAQYYHNGVYSVDFQPIPDERCGILKDALKEDFYFISEIQKIYQKIFEVADINDINPYSLKGLGFVVNSTYAIQHFRNARDYFRYLLLQNDVYDLSDYKTRFGGIGAFNQCLSELKQNYELFEFEHNQMITMKRLATLGVTKDTIIDYLDDVYEYTKDKDYFSIISIRNITMISQ